MKRWAVWGSVWARPRAKYAVGPKAGRVCSVSVFPRGSVSEKWKGGNRAVIQVEKAVVDADGGGVHKLQQGV